MFEFLSRLFQRKDVQREMTSCDMGYASTPHQEEWYSTPAGVDDYFSASGAAYNSTELVSIQRPGKPNPRSTSTSDSLYLSQFYSPLSPHHRGIAEGIIWPMPTPSETNIAPPQPSGGTYNCDPSPNSSPSFDSSPAPSCDPGGGGY